MCFIKMKNINILRVNLFCILCNLLYITYGLKSDLLFIPVHNSSIQEQAYTWTMIVSNIIFSSTDRITMICQCDHYNDYLVKYLSNVSTFLVSNNYLLPFSHIHYLVIGNDLNFFQTVFKNTTHYKFAKYLIITEMSAGDIIKLDKHFKESRYIYITIISIIKITGMIYQYHSEHFIEYNSLQLLPVFQSKLFNFQKNTRFDLHVKSYREIVCPVERCSLNLIRMIDAIYLPNKYRKQQFVQIRQNLLEIFSAFYKINRSSIDMTIKSWNELSNTLRLDDNVDVALGRHLPPDNFVNSLDIISFSKTTAVYFTATLPESMPSIQALAMPFNRQLWKYLMYLICLYLIFILLSKHIKKKKLISEAVRVIDFVAVVFNAPARLPKNFGLRIVYGMWIFFALFMTTLYSSGFQSSLLDRKFLRVIQNLTELRNQADQIVGGPAHIRNFLNDPEDPVIYDLYKRYIELKSDEVIDKLIEKNIIVAMPEFFINNIAKATQWNDSIKIYIVKEPVITQPIFILLKKGHPYVYQLEKTSSKAFDAGLLNYVNDTEYKISQSYYNDIGRYIKLNQFIIAIYGLFMGLFAAFIYFIFELTIFHLRRVFHQIKTNIFE